MTYQEFGRNSYYLHLVCDLINVITHTNTHHSILLNASLYSWLLLLLLWLLVCYDIPVCVVLSHQGPGHAVLAAWDAD